MTKDEFEVEYRRRSGISQEKYDEYFVSLPCACGDDTCYGWAAIRKEFIVDHLMFHTPDDIRKYFTQD